MRKYLYKILAISAIFIMCISVYAQQQENVLYNDHQGLFSVEIPHGCEIEEIEDPPRKVLFTYGNNSIVVAAEQYAENKTITETEKTRIRNNIGPSMEATFGSKITNIHEETIKISGAEGWVYGFTIPAQGFNMDMLYFIKDGKLYSLVSTRTSEQDQTWEKFLSTFKAQKGI